MSQSKNMTATSSDTTRPLHDRVEERIFADTTELVLQRHLEKDEKRTVARIHRLHDLLTPQEWKEIAVAVPCRVSDVISHYDSSAARLTKYFRNRLGIEIKKTASKPQEASNKSPKPDIHPPPKFEERKLSAATKKRKAADEVPEVFRDRPAKRRSTDSNSPTQQPAKDTFFTSFMKAHPSSNNNTSHKDELAAFYARTSRSNSHGGGDSFTQHFSSGSGSKPASISSSSSGKQRVESEKTSSSSTSPTQISPRGSTEPDAGDTSLVEPECESEAMRNLKAEMQKIQHENRSLKNEVEVLKKDLKEANDSWREHKQAKSQADDWVGVVERKLQEAKETNAKLLDDNDRRDSYWRVRMQALEKEKEEVQANLVRNRKRADDASKTVKVLRAALQREGWSAEEIKEGKKLPKLPGAAYTDPKDTVIDRLRAQRDQLRDALSNEGWSHEEVNRGEKAYPPTPTAHTNYNAKDVGKKFDQAAVNNACEKYGIQMTINQFAGGQKTKKWTEVIKTIFNHHGARLPPTMMNDNTTAPKH